MTTRQALSYTSALVSPIGVNATVDSTRTLRCRIVSNPLTDLEHTVGNA